MRGWRRKGQERKKNKIELHDNEITTPSADFAVIGEELCSTITNTFVLRHFLIKLNGPRFFFQVCIYLLFSAGQLFLVSGYVGFEDSSFLMKGTFFLLTGTFLLPRIWDLE